MIKMIIVTESDKVRQLDPKTAVARFTDFRSDVREHFLKSDVVAYINKSQQIEIIKSRVDNKAIMAFLNKQVLI
jgi:hypothetical protein